MSEKNWASYKHLFRNENFENIFSVGEPQNYSIKVTIDCSKLLNTNEFVANLQNLYELLYTSDIGDYELDGVLISVKEIKILDNSNTINPPFDYNLLTLY